MDNDAQSVFSYDGEGEPDAFNLSRLNEVVDRHFGGSCQLKKLNQGGYHKVRPPFHHLRSFIYISLAGI